MLRSQEFVRVLIEVGDDEHAARLEIPNSTPRHVRPWTTRRARVAVLAPERAEDYDEGNLLRCVDGHTVELPIAP